MDKSPRHARAAHPDPACASQWLPTTSPVAPRSDAPRHHPRSAMESGRSEAPCRKGKSPACAIGPRTNGVPMAYPIKQLQPVARRPPKGKGRTRCRLLAQPILRQRRQALDALAHLSDAAGGIDPNASPRPDPAAAPTRTKRARINRADQPRQDRRIHGAVKLNGPPILQPDFNQQGRNRYISLSLRRPPQV